MLNALPINATALDRTAALMAGVWDALTEKSEKASKNVQTHISWLEKMKKAVDDVGKSFTLLGQVVGAVSATSTAGILGMVRVAAPGAIMRFEQAWRSLVGVLGQMFVPIVRESVKWIREAATFLYNLSPTVKAAMAAFAIGAVTAGIAVAALTAGVWALNVALTAANTLTGGIALAIGAVVVGVAGLTAGLATAAVSLGKFGGVTEEVAAGADALGKAGKAASRAFSWGDVLGQLKAGLMVAWEFMVKVAGSIQTALAPAIAYAQRVWSAFGEGLSGLGSELINYAATAATAWQTLAEQFARLTGITATWEDTVKAGVKLLGQGIVGLVSGVAFLIEHFTKLTIVLNRLGEIRGLKDVRQAVKDIKEDFAKFDALKAKNKDDFLTAANKKQDAAPYFPNQAKLGGDVSAIKHDFWVAALRASAQQKDTPADKQAKAAEENTKALDKNNKLLEQWLNAYNHIQPSSPGLGP